MSPKEIFERMKQFSQDQESQFNQHLNGIDKQFKLEPGYTQNMVEGMASSSGGISTALPKIERQAAVNQFQELKRIINERGRSPLISEEELVKSYPKDTLSVAEKADRIKRIDNAMAIEEIKRLQEAERSIKHPGSQDITKIIDK